MNKNTNFKAYTNQNCLLLDILVTSLSIDLYCMIKKINVLWRKILNLGVQADAEFSDSKRIINGFPTKREMQILKRVAKGLTSKEIAEKLGISFETVQTHRKNLLHKYKLNSSAELIAYSIKSKWIE